jgi:hypothetical protein
MVAISWSRLFIYQHSAPENLTVQLPCLHKQSRLVGRADLVTYNSANELEMLFGDDLSSLDGGYG